MNQHSNHPAGPLAVANTECLRRQLLQGTLDRDRALCIHPDIREIREMNFGRNRGKSAFCEVRESAIHGRGVFATRFIPASTRIVEYIGERISKQESEDRGWAQMLRALSTGEAGVYIFTLDDRWDLDGNFPQNIARLINHSCSPNCEAYIERKRIWIWSLRDLEPDEELVFNYGFDLENYEEHPCRCGSPNCMGYIIAEEYREELQARRRAMTASPA